MKQIMLDILIENQKSVLKIYPNAMCLLRKFSYFNEDHIQYDDWVYYILEGPIENNYRYHEYSSGCDTETKAWINAWEKIQQDTLNKFEE
jgi:hypothetical protein